MQFLLTPPRKYYEWYLGKGLHYNLVDWLG